MKKSLKINSNKYIGDIHDSIREFIKYEIEHIEFYITVSWFRYLPVDEFTIIIFA